MCVGKSETWWVLDSQIPCAFQYVNSPRGPSLWLILSGDWPVLSRQACSRHTSFYCPLLPVTFQQ